MKGTFSNSKRGFTLVELVVVIAIIAILSGVGAMAYSGYVEYTKKGVDRQTVGEIMHALEVANYSDPGAVTSTKIFFTADQGICAPEDVSGNIKKALEDAFGEGTLENTKPSSSDWKDQSYTFDLSNIQELLKDVDLGTLTSLSAYRAATANGSSASFAGDVDELWGTVEGLVDMLEKVPEFKAQFGDDNVRNAVTNHNAIRDEVIETWTSTDGIFEILNGGGKYAAANLARNYSFVNYALKHPSLTGDMKETLEKYSGEVYDDTNGTIKIKSIVVEGYNTDGTFTGGLWTQIKNDYVTSGQAKIDALAYMGMLDVAEKVMPAGTPTDREIVESFNGYTDSLSAVLANSSLLDTISGGFTPVNISGNGICINVTKMADRSLSFEFDPPEADPRGQKTADTPAIVVSCSKEHTSTAVFTNKRFGIPPTFTWGGQLIVGEDEITQINLCNTNDDNGRCTIVISAEFTDYHITGNEFVTIEDNVIKADKEGSGQITITGTSSTHGELSATVTVVVHAPEV